MSDPSSGKTIIVSDPSEDPRPELRAGRVDRGIRVTAGLAVAVLAVIAGAVSYAHMRVLADAHGETGWRAHAFPLSVDGVEVVASLVLLADRRTGQQPGWLVWAALAAGTGASMAANVAVGAADPIGRIVAGWPAFALLMAIKLLSGLIERPTLALATPASRRMVRAASGTVLGPRSRSGTGSARSRRTGPGTGRSGPRRRVGPVDVADLMSTARTVMADVIADGGRITRPLLANRMRSAGVSVSNSRLSVLLQQLKTETGPDATAEVRP